MAGERFEAKLTAGEARRVRVEMRILGKETRQTTCESACSLAGPDGPRN